MLFSKHVMIQLLNEYDQIVPSLNSLYSALGNRDVEEWAKHLYETWLMNPTDQVAAALNQHRKTCLTFLYKVVDEANSAEDKEAFEQALIHDFQVWRLKKILHICMIMDRAQSLYKMQITGSPYVGMHWYSKSHLDPNTFYARLFPQEQRSLTMMLSTSDYRGSGTMNRRIFQLIYGMQSLGLLNDEKLARWSRPVFATFTKPSSFAALSQASMSGVAAIPHATSGVQGTFSYGVASGAAEIPHGTTRGFSAVPHVPSSGVPTASVVTVLPDHPMETTGLSGHGSYMTHGRMNLSNSQMSPEPLGAGISGDIRKIVLGFVEEYDSQEIQMSLTRLYNDQRISGMDLEAWAHSLYEKLREDPFDQRAAGLNQDRKKCLNLCYKLVDAWEEAGFSKEFESAIVHYFKPRRLLRILGVCLIMDRSQSLYKMEILGSSAVGMHWYSKLHFAAESKYAVTHLSPQERLLWDHTLSSYKGSATMNKRLFRLLFSDDLKLQANKLMARWSKPCMAPGLVSNTPNIYVPRAFHS